MERLLETKVYKNKMLISVNSDNKGTSELARLLHH